MSDQLAELEVTRTEGVVGIVLRGEIDLSNVDEIERRIDEAVVASTGVVVDLRRVDYMDSQAVRLLHGLARRLRAGDVPLTVVAPEGSVARELLELTRLTELVPVRESPD